MKSETQRGADGAAEGSADEARRMEAIGRLAAGIAHDFNNVLAAIRGHGQIALRALDGIAGPAGGDGPDTLAVEREALARLRADVAAIDESTRRAAALTRQLAALNLPAGSDVAPLELNAFAAELHGLARRLVPPSIDITLAPPGDSVSALANVPGLLQASLELVLDLRDALDDGGRIEIAVVAGGAAGSGVALLLRHSAVAPVPRPRTHQLVAELLGRLGGELRLEGASGEPALALHLRATSAEPGEAAAATSGAAVPRDAESGGATVLLVEDDAAVRRIARTVLERLGYRVVPAGDGPEALRMVELLASDDVVPDLLVTDVTMPSMSGPQLAAELRRRAPGIGVLFMSGMGEPAASDSATAAGREDFLQKPFTLEELADRVARLLAAP